MPVLRRIVLLLLAGFCATLFAQAPARGSGKLSLFYSTRPDAWIVVRKHQLGPDLVEISMQDADYPPQALQDQVNSLAKYAGSAPWAVRVFKFSADPKKPDMTFVRASFAINGLIDASQPIYHINPIAQAMAASPKGHEISAVDIVFEGQHAGPKTLSRYEGTGAIVEGQDDPGRIGLEYRVKILTHDPGAIHIPDDASAAPVPAPQRPASHGLPWIFWCALALVSLAAGALVYFILLRLPPKSSR
jgi:hypothetical protein